MANVTEALGKAEIGNKMSYFCHLNVDSPDLFFHFFKTKSKYLHNAYRYFRNVMNSKKITSIIDSNVATYPQFSMNQFKGTVKSGIKAKLEKSTEHLLSITKCRDTALKAVAESI